MEEESPTPQMRHQSCRMEYLVQKTNSKRSEKSGCHCSNNTVSITLERRLDDYKDPQAMYKAQGSNAFTRAYRKTMTRDDKIRANIERRDRLTQRLYQLRGRIE